MHKTLQLEGVIDLQTYRRVRPLPEPITSAHKLNLICRIYLQKYIHSEYKLSNIFHARYFIKLKVYRLSLRERIVKTNKPFGRINFSGARISWHGPAKQLRAQLRKIRAWQRRS